MVKWSEAVRKLRIKSNRTEANISKEQWVQHFSKLLGSKEIGMEEGQVKGRKRAEERKEGSVDKGLDEGISTEELEQVIRGTKNKRHHRERRNNGGIFKGTGKRVERRDNLREIFKQIRNKGELPEGRERAKIFPIYKAGDEDKFSNYRVVTLLDIRYKIIAKIMVKRLNIWIEREEILKESEAF